MGYTSHVTGRIEIRPPLKWSAVRHSAFLVERAQRADVDVRYEISTTVEETDEGTITRRSAIAVVPIWEDSFKAHNLAKRLAEVAAEVYAADSTLHGHLVRSGEEQGDVERYSIGPSGNVVTEKATLRWEDGTEVDAS